MSQDRSHIDKRRNLLYLTINDLYDYLEGIMQLDKKGATKINQV